jgi:hypothetical protein
VELGNTETQLIATPDSAAPSATPDVSLPLKTIVFVLLGISALALFAGVSIPRAEASAETPAAK